MYSYDTRKLRKKICKRECGVFQAFLPFFGPNNLPLITLSCERNFLVRRVPSTLQNISKHPPGEQQLLVKSVFSSVMYTAIHGTIESLPRVTSTIFWPLWEIFVVLARTWTSRKHPGSTYVVSGCLRLLSGAPDALTHPARSVPQFRGLYLLVRCCSCPQVKRLVVVFSLISYTLPFDQFRPLQHLKSGGVVLCLEPDKGQSEENHKLQWMKHQASAPALC